MKRNKAQYIITDGILRDYLKINREIDRLTHRKEEMRLALIENGNIETESFKVDVTNRSRPALVSVSEAIEKLGAETVKKLKLVKTIRFKAVTVKRKAA